MIFKKLIFIIVLNNIIFAASGEDVYNTYCSNCHTINGGSNMGPDFNLVSYIRTKDEIKEYIMKPSLVFRKFGYSANAMPELPLKPEEVDDVVDYINKLQPFKQWMKK